MSGKTSANRFSHTSNGSSVGMLGAVTTTAELLRFFPATVELSNGATFVTSGRTAPGDGGGASFRYDASDTLSPDNGGTIRVDAGGRRWHVVNVNYFVSVADFWSHR